MCNYDCDGGGVGSECELRQSGIMGNPTVGKGVLMGGGNVPDII